MASNVTTPKKTANFRTYEGMYRLLAAFLAAHPGIRIDYKLIAEHFGYNNTTSAIEHRFRPLRKAAKALSDAHQKGQDVDEIDALSFNLKEAGKAGDESPRTMDNPSALAVAFGYGPTKKRNPPKAAKGMAQLYGESTPDGLAFQFRDVKKKAGILTEAADLGLDPKAAWEAGHVVGTPTIKPEGSGTAAVPASVPGTGRKRGRPPKNAAPIAATMSTGAAPTTAQRRRSAKIQYREDATNDESSERDYDNLDLSPSPAHRVKRARNMTFDQSAMDRARPSPLSMPPMPAGGISRASTMGTETEVSTPMDDITFVKTEKAAPKPAPNGGSIYQNSFAPFNPSMPIPSTAGAPAPAAPAGRFTFSQAAAAAGQTYSFSANNASAPSTSAPSTQASFSTSFSQAPSYAPGSFGIAPSLTAPAAAPRREPRPTFNSPYSADYDPNGEHISLFGGAVASFYDDDTGDI
ncbi:hypothetical protein OQA88_6405 [Cercophora sp. LCS_1]